MAEENLNKKKRKAPRQAWKPHISLAVLYRIWMVVFGAAKIVLGAVSTVVLICGICGLLKENFDFRVDFSGFCGILLSRAIAKLTLADF